MTSSRYAYMNRRSKLAAATAAALLALGASTAVAVAGGNEGSVAAETGAPAATAPASVARIAQTAEFGGFGVHADQAKAIPTPAAARTSVPWYVVPADRGACLSPGDGGLVCGTSEQLKAGRILAVDRELAPLNADGTVGNGVSRAPLRVAGLVADDVTAVVAKDDAGKEIGRARVTSNVYEIPLNAASSFGSLELQHANGTLAATLEVHGSE
jgi:hypothetical protein